MIGRFSSQGGCDAAQPGFERRVAAVRGALYAPEYGGLGFALGDRVLDPGGAETWLGELAALALLGAWLLGESLSGPIPLAVACVAAGLWLAHRG